MRKEIAMGILCVTKEDTKKYVVEVLVKLLVCSRKLALLGGLVCDLWDCEIIDFLFYFQCTN